MLGTVVAQELIRHELLGVVAERAAWTEEGGQQWAQWLTGA